MGRNRIVTTALTRRGFVTGSLAGLSCLSVAGCSGGATAYDAAVAEMTSPLPASPDLHELVRYASLAANGHNTQPWTFLGRKDGVDILPDFTRRTPVVDPDDHHLFASLGCAAENMSQAARARGMSGEAGFAAEADGRVRVDLTPGARDETTLLAAIPARQCSRNTYDGKSVPSDVMRRLEHAAKIEGVEPVFIADKGQAESILNLVIAGNSRQLEDPAFLAELKAWIRFDANAAVKARDGLSTAASGTPSMPSWLGPIVFDLFFSKQAENDKYAEQIRSSSGLIVFVASSNDKQGWVAAGRAYQRFALQATVDGLKHAFLNQAVEVPSVRRDLQALLGLGERRPDLVVRYGYGPAMPRSLRRKPADVIVGANA
jgi:hypothetical protein